MSVRSASVGRVALGATMLCAIAVAVGAPAFAAPVDDRAGHERCRPSESDAGPVGSLLEAPSCAAEQVAADDPLPPPETPRILDPGSILEPDLPELSNLDAAQSDDDDSGDDDGSDSDSDESDTDGPESDEPESDESDTDESDTDESDTDESDADESDTDSGESDADEADGSSSDDGDGSTDESDSDGKDTEEEGAAEEEDSDDGDTAAGADAGDDDASDDADTGSPDAAAGSAEGPTRRDSGADTAVGNVVLPGVGDAVGGAASSGLDWTGALTGPEEHRHGRPGEHPGAPDPTTESTARVDPRALAGPVDGAAQAPEPATALPPGGEPAPAAVAFTQALPSPTETGRDARAILPSLLLTLLLLAALALPAGALDRAAGEHTDRVDALLARLRAPHAGVEGAPALLTAVAVTAVAGAVLLGFLAPAFPFDGSAPALLIGLTLAFVVVTAAQQGAQVLYLRQWWGIRCHLVPFPGFLLLGVFGVVFSRAIGLEPGLVLGTLTAFGAARPLRPDEEGPAAALAATALTAVGGTAWVLRDPLISAVGTPGTFFPAVLGVVLTTITVAAATNLVFALAPVPFLLGGPVLRWSPALWAVFVCIGGLGFVHLVARPAADGLSGRVGLLATLLGCYLLATGALWYWLRYAPARQPHPAHPGSEPVTESIRLVSAVSTSAAPGPSGPSGSAW